MDTIVKPKSQKLELVKSDIDPDGFSHIKRLIDASMFTFVRLYDNGDGVYIDDEASMQSSGTSGFTVTILNPL